MAVRFDAATDRVRYTGAGLPDPATAFSLTAWVYLAVDRDDWSIFARMHSSGTTTCGMGYSSSGTAGPAYVTAGGNAAVSGDVAVGVWARVGYSVAANAATVYRWVAGDAIAVASGAVSGAAAPTELCIGGRGNTDATEWFNGRVTQVRVWAAALTQAQIMAEWSSPVAVRTANLTAWWPLLSAADLTDKSGNARHLTAISTGATSPTTEADPVHALTLNQPDRRDLTRRPARGVQRRSLVRL